MLKNIMMGISFLLSISQLSAVEDKALLAGNDFLMQQITGVCTTGDAKRIAKWCVEQVRSNIDRDRLDADALKRTLEDADLERLCYLAHYFTRLSKDGTRQIPELKDRLFVQWLIDRPDVLEQLVFSDRASKSGVSVLYALWKDENLKDVTLNLALGASLAADLQPVRNCIAKYFFYRDAYLQKRLYPQFDALEPWEMAILLSGNEDLNDLAWGLDYVDSQNVPVDKASRKFCSWIPYRKCNQKGISIHKGAVFYDHNPTTLSIYLEYGGVCGAVSTAASRFFKAKGVPSYTIGQPDHCAFVYKHTDGSWKIGNNIYGWVWSNGSRGPWSGPTPIINCIARYRGKDMTRRSSLCQQLAELSRDPENRDVLLLAAIDAAPCNLAAWNSRFSIKSSQTTEKELIDLAYQLKVLFADDPFTLELLLMKYLPLNWTKEHKYSLCTLLLTDKNPKVSRDIFMNNFVKLAQQDLPELRKGELAYGAKTRGNWFEKWVGYYLMNRTTSKDRERILYVIEQILASPFSHEQVFTDFLSLYERLLDIWKDEKLNKRAAVFVQNRLQGNIYPSIGKRLSILYVKLSYHK